MVNASPKVLSLKKLFESPPPPLDFVIPGLLSGTVGALIGMGGSGKSFFALEAAIAVACESPDGDLLKIRSWPSRSGKVTYIACEDPDIIIWHRMHAIGKHLPSHVKEEVSDKVKIISSVGSGLLLPRDAELFLRAAEGARLCIIDTLSRVCELDENSNNEMSHLVSILESISSQTGAAILFLHHISKAAAAAKDGSFDQYSARGASALIENSRWSGYLTRMTPTEAAQLSSRDFDRKPIGENSRKFIKFGISKSNYAPIPDNPLWLCRYQDGVLLPETLFPAIPAKKTSKKENEENDEVRIRLGHTDF